MREEKKFVKGGAPTKGRVDTKSTCWGGFGGRKEKLGKGRGHPGRNPRELQKCSVSAKKPSPPAQLNKGGWRDC